MPPHRPCEPPKGARQSTTMTREEIQFRILRLLQDNPQLSQRDLAAELGVSVGSTHYCLRALVDKGWVKANNFAKSTRKTRYLYQLTPSGIAEKAALTRRFLKRKREEYQAIRAEIAELEKDLKDQ
ncbi:transcriptional regulator, AsnC family [Alkalilimnicola ehrlichii MLHE-1]|uniref:Transcriptional regulator, AsnC family n=2 Tax=Alkalilimnicola ehrlichii TaxID=351052 RepID=Q0A681_ALKEH|nr:transcriptional regulator, AsnC family [Alkalilimnicola ehrlichii MLHE-1]